MQTLAVKNAQETYQTQRILTASPLDLIVMLYDGIHKNIVLAKRAIEKNDIQNCHNKLIKTQDIIGELINSLDLSIPLSGELFNIYEFILRSLQQANVKKDTKLLDDILEITDGLRDAWKEISLSTVDASVSPIQQESEHLEAAQL